MAPKKSKSRQVVSISEILRVAEELPDQSISLRSVGQKLGISGQALYRYVDSTEHLIELVALARWPSPDGLPDVSLGWHDWYRQALEQLRQSFINHPGLSRPAATSGRLSSNQLLFTERGLQVFAHAGVPPAEGILYFRILVHATLDHVVRCHQHAGGKGESYLQSFWDAVRDSEEVLPLLDDLVADHRKITPEEAFEFNISTLLLGIAEKARLKIEV
ncbi:MAG: TetR/AcrR family transcriptional regulator C-terminal domain-containing protein [Pseudomonadota bacterium]